MSRDEIDALRRLKSQLDGAEGDDIRSANELIDKLIELQIRIEQERY